MGDIKSNYYALKKKKKTKEKDNRSNLYEKFLNPCTD